MSHVLVCTDGSAYAESVYDHAGWAAGRLEASVEVLYVIDHQRGHADTTDLSGNMVVNGREELLSELAELDARKSKILQAHGRDILAAAEERLVAQGVTSPRLTLRHGSFIDTVAEVEDRADLVVIGKRGETAGLASDHLGANLERVVRGSRHPVLVTSRAFKPVETVLIAYDGGPSAQKAIRHAAEGQLLKDLDILILRVGNDTPANRDSLVAAAAELEKTGRRVRTVLKAGDPEDVIAETIAAENVDLLVVGAYGHSRIRQLIVGSTTTTLIRTCRIPLLMFR